MENGFLYCLTQGEKRAQKQAESALAAWGHCHFHCSSSLHSSWIFWGPHWPGGVASHQLGLQAGVLLGDECCSGAEEYKEQSAQVCCFSVYPLWATLSNVEMSELFGTGRRCLQTQRNPPFAHLIPLSYSLFPHQHCMLSLARSPTSLDASVPMPWLRLLGSLFIPATQWKRLRKQQALACTLPNVLFLELPLWGVCYLS